MCFQIGEGAIALVSAQQRLQRWYVPHSLSGYRPEFDNLVQGWIRDGVNCVGVVGVDAASLEDIVGELCVDDGARGPYSMLTASHPGERLSEALELANVLTGEYAGPVQVRSVRSTTC